MFSKKILNPTPIEPSRAFDVQALVGRAIGNPYLSAGGAAALFLATGLGLIAMLGDPKAGTP